MIKYRSDLNKIIDLSLPVVEVGVAEGRFSLDILKWGIPRLYLVDLWESTPTIWGTASYPDEWHNKNFEMAQLLTRDYQDKVVFLKGPSVEMAKQVPDESLGMCYIDACHSYECVLSDLEAWYPKVKPGHIIAGHDFLQQEYGVRKAVLEFTKKNKIFEVLTITENKTEDAGFYFRKPC